VYLCHTYSFSSIESNPPAAARAARRPCAGEETMGEESKRERAKQHRFSARLLSHTQQRVMMSARAEVNAKARNTASGITTLTELLLSSAESIRAR